MFKISINCHIKRCQSLKQRTIIKNIFICSEDTNEEQVMHSDNKTDTMQD